MKAVYVKKPVKFNNSLYVLISKDSQELLNITEDDILKITVEKANDETEVKEQD